MKLSFGLPLDSRALLLALDAHAVPGLETVSLSDRRVTRAVRAPSGPAIASVSLCDEHLELEVSTTYGDDLGWLAGRVSQWFDLDANPQEIDGALQDDPLIGPLVAARPGLRILGFPDGFEAAILTVLGQQVSLAAARTFGSRLVRAFGEPAGDGLLAFPTPERLASLSASRVQEAVGVTGSRARTVLDLSAAFVTGLDLTAPDRCGVREALLALRGIGPWTVDYLALRVMGDRDAFPADDLVLRRALGVSSAKEAEFRAEAWRPFRAYGVFHLWTQAAYG